MPLRRYLIRRASHAERSFGEWKLEIDGAPMLYGTEAQIRSVAADVAAEQWFLYRRVGIVAIDDGYGERTLETHGSSEEADAAMRRDLRPVTELFVGRGSDERTEWRICSEGRTLKAFATRSAAMEHARWLIGALWRAQAPAAIYAEDLAGQFRLDATLGTPRTELPELKCGANFTC